MDTDSFRQAIIWSNGGYISEAYMRHSASTLWNDTINNKESFCQIIVWCLFDAKTFSKNNIDLIYFSATHGLYGFIFGMKMSE